MPRRSGDVKKRVSHESRRLAVEKHTSKHHLMQVVEKPTNPSFPPERPDSLASNCYSPIGCPSQHNGSLTTLTDLPPALRLLHLPADRVLVPLLRLQQLHPQRALRPRRRRVGHHRPGPAVVRGRAPQLCRERALLPAGGRPAGPPVQAPQGGCQGRHHRDPRGRLRAAGVHVGRAEGAVGAAGGRHVSQQGGEAGRPGRDRRGEQHRDVCGVGGDQLARGDLLE